MREFSKQGRLGLNRRQAIGGGLSLLAATAGTVAYLAPWPGSGDGRALAAPSEKELMAAGPLPENAMGEATAPNTVIEYASMTCPHCARFHKAVMPGLTSKFIETGKVRFIFREFPLDNLAFAAAMLARCAGPEKFFPFVDAMFVKQEEWAFGQGDPVPRLFNMAKQAGFTKQTFDSCLRDQKLLDGLAEMRKRANEKFGVNSTPTVFVNGQLVKGLADLAAIEKLLKPEDKKQ